MPFFEKLLGCYVIETLILFSDWVLSWSSPNILGNCIADQSGASWIIRKVVVGTLRQAQLPLSFGYLESVFPNLSFVTRFFKIRLAPFLRSTTHPSNVSLESIMFAPTLLWRGARPEQYYYQCKLAGP